MSKDFESLDQPLMVQIIRRKELPPVKYFLEPHCDNINSKYEAHFFQSAGFSGDLRFTETWG